jgi:hypothetical protein
MKMERKGIVMTAGFMVALFFVSASVYAETVWKEGPVECLGIKTHGYSLVTNESWVSRDVEGASSCMQYVWTYHNRDGAMKTIDILSNIVPKDKALYEMYSYENKNSIKKKQERPHIVLVYLYDNGVIQIEIFDENTGRSEAWRFK